MKHIQWILPSVFALTAVSGCGLSEQDDDNAIIIEEQGPSASEAYQQALETYTGVTCERVFRCPEKADDDLLLVMAKYSSEQACQDNFSLVVLSDGADELIADGVAQGRILYDVEQARRCLAGIEDSVKGARCAFKFAGSVEEIPACEGMYQGQLEAGDTCALDEECQQGLYCAAISSQVCGGVCQAFASPGQGCGQGAAQCDSESTCLLEQGAQTGTCVANGSLSRGDTCSDSAQCDETSGCNRQGVCEALQNQPPLPAGQTCQFLGVPCTPGQICGDLDLQTLQGTCKAPGAQGAPCVVALQCSNDLTCRGLDADTGQKGTCQPLAEPGQACETDFDCDNFSCLGGTCQTLAACIQESN